MVIITNKLTWIDSLFKYYSLYRANKPFIWNNIQFYQRNSAQKKLWEAVALPILLRTNLFNLDRSLTIDVNF